jgi:hypothetical protein
MPVSPFGMLPITTAQQRFTYVGHILQPQLPTAARLAVATSPHGSVARLSGGGDSVPSASHPGVTPSARLGRVPVAEHRIFVFPDKYACDFVSHVPGRRRRGRMAVGGSDSERRRAYASACETPSSHLWECCVACTERSDGVAKRHGRRAARALIGCRDKRRRKGDWESRFAS